MFYIDIDGVLADFNQFVVSKLGEGKGIEMASLEKRYPNKEKEIEILLHSPETYTRLLPVSYKNFEFVKKYRSDIILITSRPERCMRATFSWLSSYGISLPILFTKRKSEQISRREGNVQGIVDDLPSQLKFLSALNYPLYIYSQPWNLEFRNSNPTIPTIKSLMDLEDICHLK